MNLVNIEFYTTPSGDVEIKADNKSVVTLNQSGNEQVRFINSFIEMMKEFYTEAYSALSELYTASSPNPIAYRFRIVSRFIRCNQGEYDSSKMDIDEFGRFNFEEVKCPLRGECKLEGICCRPKFNTTLSDRELEVLRLTVDNKSTNEIAEQLFISHHTVNNHRRNIHIKTKTSSIAMLVKYWYDNNLK